MGTLPDAKHKGCLSLTEDPRLVCFSLNIPVLTHLQGPHLSGPAPHPGAWPVSCFSLGLHFPEYVMRVITLPLPTALG